MGSAIEYIANCSCMSSKANFPDPYRFSFDNNLHSPENEKNFQSNAIKTSKYTLFNFLPKALLLQFKRFANVYFLFIAILLSISIISPIGPLTAWGPLIIVIGISMIRQGYQDYQRYRSDQKLNHEQKTRVIRKGEQLQIEWSQVLVGDICKVQNQEMFPADLILLCSSSEGNVAFIETASLDGEKNLKPRSSYPETAALKTIDDKIEHCKGEFQGDKPNKDLQNFQAKISLQNGKVINYSKNKQLLYRGTKLKNTKYIYGLVIYTGKNTKIILNSQSQSEKMSQIEIKVNYILGFIIIFQIILCLFCGIAYGITRNNDEQPNEIDDYIDWPNYPVALDGFLVFLTYIALLNTMIPISLIVSIEMVKTFQKYFIEKDRLMYSDYRGKYVSVQTSSLNEQLGQIEYIFTDKTGTLTLNVMEFKIAVIGSTIYGDTSLITEKKGQPKNNIKGFSDDGLRKILNNGTGDEALYKEIVVKNRQGTDQIVFKRKRELAQQYFLLLGIAHEVMSEKNKDGLVIYQGPSPDEIALVDAAKSMDYEFVKSSQAQTSIKVRGKIRTFQLLQTFGFSSFRQRMSIIFRDSRDNKIKMYIKGADSMIKRRLNPGKQLDLDDELNKFSNVGLRTLLVAMRIISQQEYSTFLSNVQKIPQADREKQMPILVDEIQKDLYLIGATAVLDRLQDDVPQTIRDMLRANIKVWMLTGDKLQTAENIAKSCKLIQPDFHIIRFNVTSKFSQKGIVVDKQAKDMINNRLLQDLVGSQLQKLIKLTQQLQKDGTKKAFVVQSEELKYVLVFQSTKRLLAKVAKSCQAVVGCRLQPLQKAEVVSVVRTYLNKITLAIGDGANDVPMIKTAHIGIGLYGQEGMGAVQASDYALPQFRMLWRLLFVHGRWNYIRISEMILYFFYKNMLFTLPQFITAFYNGFSGQTVYEDIYITLYNLIFTAMPLIIRAVLQQDVNYVYKRQEQQFQADEPILTGKSMISQQGYLPDRYGINKYFYRLFPKIYFIGQENCIFNYKNYLLWMLEGMVQAVIITLFCFYILGDQSLRASGISNEYWLVGITIYSAVILIVTFKLATHTRFWSSWLFLSIIITSLGFYAAYTWISNFFLSPSIYGTAQIGWTTPQTYFIVLFCICVVLFVDGVIVFIDFRRGSIASQMREVVKYEQINNRYFYDDISLYITQGLTEQAPR